MRTTLLTVLTAILIGGAAVRADAASGACASTPAAALLALRHAAVDHAATDVALREAHGFRVTTLRWDPFLRHGWAVIQSCEHLERPSFMVQTDVAQAVPGSASLSGTDDHAHMNQAVSVVRAGDLVRLWRTESSAHIEMMATSEESGGVGARVRVRLVTVRDDDGQVSPPLYLAGIVRGLADVEMTQ